MTSTILSFYLILDTVLILVYIIFNWILTPTLRNEGYYPPIYKWEIEASRNAVPCQTSYSTVGIQTQVFLTHAFYPCITYAASYYNINLEHLWLGNQNNN